MNDRATPGTLAGSVLVVEDDDDIRETLGCILTEEGYRVSMAPHGEAALAQLAADSDLPRVILLDLTMPRMSGRALAERLRAEPRWSGIPVVVMSAVNDFDLEIAAVGAVGGLRKPVDLCDLLAVVERYAAPPR